MKKINKATRVGAFCVALITLLCVFVSAATPSEMKENGEISDGPVRFGDARDGIVSDVSSEMSDIGSEISEFVETVIPGAQGTSGINTNESTRTPDITTASSRTEATQQTNNTTEMQNEKNAKWGIVIAIIVVIAVVAAIFFLVKRK